jgi:glycerol-3-phosphate dehydrogenase (NAD(P)+)
MTQIAVLGAGSWGTALARVLVDNGHLVRVWTPETDVVEDIRSNRLNSKYLPEFPFSAEVFATDSMEEAVQGVDAVLMAVPSGALRSVATLLGQVMGHIPLLANAGKGLEMNTGLRLSQVLMEVLPETAPGAVVISGPNLATEVAKQLPSATVAASADESHARQIQDIFSSRCLRVYRSSDVAGVELCGALKNVLAIGAGISDGMGFGDNTKAALVTRGLTEMMRLGVALGAQPKTFMGLAGIGDLLATCSSHLSRNLRVGRALGRGMSVDQAITEVKQVAEGVPTCKAAYNLSQTLEVYTPITEQLYKILFEGRDTREAVTDLMLRESKEE